MGLTHITSLAFGFSKGQASGSLDNTKTLGFYEERAAKSRDKLTSVSQTPTYKQTLREGFQVSSWQLR